MKLKNVTTYFLYFKHIDGYEPTDGERNYLCLTVLTPESEGMKTLCIDEDTYTAVLEMCEHAGEVATAILSSISAHLKAGVKEGYIFIAPLYKKQIKQLELPKEKNLPLVFGGGSERTLIIDTLI